MLSCDFDVVGTATDGLQAVDIARHVDPEVIVLDVDMPGLNGFQTCRALAGAGLAATPIVFLSMHDADEIVAEAFRCGGSGYVFKQRVGRDLVEAIDQALEGRSFAPSLNALLPLAAGGLHAMQLYDDVESFVGSVAALFDLTLRRGGATCIIGNRRIRDGLNDRLCARGWDVAGSAGHKRYLALDEGEALARIMRHGRPDPDRLAEIAGELDDYRRAVCDGATSRLTVCGNMVVSLIGDGNTQAAMALESHWGRLTRDLPFLTVCGYASSCFRDDASGLWSCACTEHRALSLAADV